MGKKKPPRGNGGAIRGNSPSSRPIDKGSFSLGALAGVLVFALLAIAYFSTAAPAAPTRPAASEPLPKSQPQVDIIGSKDAPGAFQIVVKNNLPTNIVITGLKIGGKDVNATGAMLPGQSLVLNYLQGNGSGGSQPAPGGGSGNQNGSQAGNGTGIAPNAPLAVTTSSLAQATQDQEYHFALEAAGGTGSYSWSISGTPSTLSVSQSGMISGTPLEKGTYPVHIEVIDGQSAASADLQLVVN